MQIDIDQPSRPDVRSLLEEHLADMFATSPPESVHALDVDALAGSDVTFWSLRAEGELLGCAALKELDPTHGELKSMRTAAAARGRGVAGLLLARIVDESERRGYERISLETGTEEFFEPARRLYQRHGFTVCAPFADYVLDSHSVFMTRRLR